MATNSVMFNKLSGQNDSLYGKIIAPLRQVIVDNASKDTEDGVLLRAMYNVETSDNFAEASTGQTGLGTMKPVEEGGKTTNDSIREAYKKILEHTTFKNRIVITAEMLEDAKVGTAVRKAKPLVAQFGESYVRTQAEFATKALVSGKDKTFTFNGKVFDRTTGDGEALFSPQHKCRNTGNQSHSNVFSNDFGSDATMLNILVNKGRNFKNDTGNITRNLFDTIMIPGNTPQLEALIKVIIATERVPNSANNDINTQMNKWQLIVNPYWIAENGSEPYILMSSKALKATSGNIFFNRTMLQIKEDVDEEWNMTLSARARFSCGFFDWRHVLMGGVTNGTTIPT